MSEEPVKGVPARSPFILKILSICAVPILIGLWFALKHHNMTAKKYTAGSVCDHLYDKRNAVIWAGINHPLGSSSDPEYNEKRNALTESAEEDEEARFDEFTAVLDGLRAANQALISSRRGPLFCLPEMTKLNEANLYIEYWAAADQRTKNPSVCGRDYAEDILAYVTERHACPASTKP